jgi:hypothetical protein
VVATPVYLVHGVSIGVPPTRIRTPILRDSLIEPPQVLRCRALATGAVEVFVNELGGLVAIQEVGTAVDRAEAMAYYDEEQFGPAYVEALKVAGSVLHSPLDDFSFSYVWHARSDRIEYDWQYVSIPRADSHLVREATFASCLADIVDVEIRKLPLRRAGGEVDRAFVTQALDLFALAEPSQVWTSGHEIEMITGIFGAWKLDQRIRQLQARFDQASTGFSFFWEAAEHRREASITLGLAVIAVVALVQADKQIHEVLQVPTATVDKVILSVAAALVLLGICRTAAPLVRRFRARRSLREFRRELDR